MFDLSPRLGRDEPLRLVVLGAHADDGEIGAGGTLLRLAAERPRLEVLWAVATGDAAREAEATASVRALLGDAVQTAFGRFRDGHLPHQGADVKAWVHGDLGGFAPHLVLAPATHDRHQDHRTMGELAWQAFRQATIAEYEIPKWEGDLVPPTAFVRLSDAVAAAKVDHLMAHFGSQQAKSWYDADLFRGLLRLRGAEAGARWAEGFTCRKLAW